MMNSARLDSGTFTQLYGDNQNSVVPDAEKKVKKLLLKLIEIYQDVFSADNFEEETQKIFNQDAIPKFKK